MGSKSARRLMIDSVGTENNRKGKKRKYERELFERKAKAYVKKKKGKKRSRKREKSGGSKRERNEIYCALSLLVWCCGLSSRVDGARGHQWLAGTLDVREGATQNRGERLHVSWQTPLAQISLQVRMRCVVHLARRNSRHTNHVTRIEKLETLCNQGTPVAWCRCRRSVIVGIQPGFESTTCGTLMVFSLSPHFFPRFFFFLSRHLLIGIGMKRSVCPLLFLGCP